MTGCAWHAGHHRTGRQGSSGLPRSKGFGSVSSSAPRIMVACAEIRDLPARGNQSMTCADCEATPACLDSFSTESAQKVPAPREIFLLAGTLSQQMRGWLRV